jgi:hypothetical protein
VRPSIAILALALTVSAAGVARAGPYEDELTKCISAKMSDADRSTVAVWLYEEMSANPAVKAMSNVTEAQRTEARKAAAALAQRLLLDDCRAPAAAAFKNEGGGVAMRAFWDVGQSSIGTLARDPAVLANMGQVSQYLDTAKLVAAFSDQAGGAK